MNSNLICRVGEMMKVNGQKVVLIVGGDYLIGEVPKVLGNHGVLDTHDILFVIYGTSTFNRKSSLHFRFNDN